MRELKFRAYQDNEMLFSPISSNYGLQRFFGLLYEDAPVMQYTGFKDVNRKEEYENDIIKTDKGIGVIEWDFEFGCWSIHYVNDDSDMLDSWGQEVIGNIHENPELLKEEKK
jgi:uncharacterized phage protein (TIGR01671 family)